MKIDVFISYEHNSKSIADSIVSSFEREKIRCWYAPRDVIGDYATSIVDAIENSTVFILILNGESSNSPHVLNEVEMAYKKNIEQSQAITIVPFKVADAEFSRAMEYYIKRIHWIDATSVELDAAIEDLKAKVKKILCIKDEVISPSATERTQNKYFTAEDKKEINRLRTQANILKKFDGGVYESISSSFGSLKVLDLGSNCGDTFVTHFGNLTNLTKAIGLEYDKEAVEKANAKYSSEIFKFYVCDVESENFVDELSDICEKEKVEKFDIVSISMLILHLKKPYNLLKTIRKFMRSGGKIIIRDIDDGFNIAYPDKDKIFSEMIKICSESKFSGYRSSGREIYTLLKDVGFKKIKLENLGISTVDMDYDEKEALFDTYFEFIAEDTNLMATQYPSIEKYLKYQEWLRSNLDKIESEFMRDDFFFVLGFLLFTAEK